ncbi:hypothetical protein EVJ58_g4027 [Rhodofomes roseus]|uniref:Uncharacterized protein n=1 Tax=Rhodofomes roseus TaxID=34475 RepID=A0A4Y9YI15_9APHY|nr:hypothetical protein EVJ58_g4027 [Rhodofomes roseus]
MRIKSTRTNVPKREPSTAPITVEDLELWAPDATADGDADADTDDVVVMEELDMVELEADDEDVDDTLEEDEDTDDEKDELDGADEGEVVVDGDEEVGAVEVDGGGVNPPYVQPVFRGIYGPISAREVRR